MRHLGDLGNITADASGMVEEMLRDSLLGSDVSFIGRVVIVHEGRTTCRRSRMAARSTCRLRAHRTGGRGRHQPRPGSDRGV
jgi:Cu/Zn superoxide dismutase